MMSRRLPSGRLSYAHNRMKTTTHAPCSAAAHALSVHNEQQRRRHEGRLSCPSSADEDSKGRETALVVSIMYRVRKDTFRG